MQLSGKAAIVTGGGSGIGRELCLQLARQGCRVSVADLNAGGAAKVVEEIVAVGQEAIAVFVDVADNASMARAVQQHMDTFAGLHILCLNAGISEKGNLLKMEGGWQQTLDVDLRAQIAGSLLGLKAMQATGNKGVILFTSSAGGLYPMPLAPVYAAAKAGLVHFARSISDRLSRKGIRVCTICPEYVDTPLARGVAQEILVDGYEGPRVPHGNSFLSPAQVAACGLALILDESKDGTVAFVRVNGKTYEYCPPYKAIMRRANYSVQQGLPTKPSLVEPEYLQNWALHARPTTNKRVQVFRLSVDFRAATRLVEEVLTLPRHGQVLVRRAFAGVNASDVNFSAGRYFGTPEQSQKLLPFYAGFEAVGVVAALGSGVKGLRVGDCIAELSYGTFAEWGSVLESLALRVPTCSPEMVALLTSGLTASIGLEVAGGLSTGESVLVTAAAGGTGQFAVQLAKLAGNHVVATCGSADKASLLKRLGADRVINYNEEDLKNVLRKEYSKGIDLIWESVGGSMFDICTKALANGGRLVIIGMMSQYAAGWKPSVNKGLPELLLQKSASINGFFLPQHSRLYRPHLKQLTALWTQGRLHASVDPSTFIGVDQAAEAVEYLQEGKSVGKVVLQLTQDHPNRHAKSRL